MGKISEALKKADKEKGLKPLNQEGNRLTIDNGTNAAPNLRKMPKRSKRVPSEVEIKMPQMDSAPFSAKKTAMVEKPVLDLQAGAHSIPDGSITDTEMLSKKDNAIPADQAKKAREHENATIVMATDPKPDKSMPSAPSVETPADEEGRESEVLKNVKTTQKREIKISYSKTKVQIMDPETLKNNKIFSMFDDIETSDQINILRTQVLKKLKVIGGNSILVTSANPYEGKTFTSINLGVSIAKEFNRTVLIIDADLRKPTRRHTAFSTKFFTLDVNVGLTDYLKGEADIPDILINPGINKLTLIPSGRPVFNAPELLNSSRMEEMMKEIKSRYPSDRLVIVDGPAMLPFPDAVILSRYVDGVLPVVEIEKTSTDDLKKMMDGLKGTPVLGTVLNKNRG